MDRGEVLRWLEEHPREVHGVPSEIIDRCEAEVRKHAAENAWGAARAYVEGRMHTWEREWGCHATESSVARTVCPMLANELKRHEPVVRPGSERELAGREVIDALEPEARQKLIEWVRELAQDVEHRIWKEVVRFTRREARTLVNEGRVSSDDSYEATGNFAHKAAHVAQLVMEDYERQALQ